MKQIYWNGKGKFQKLADILKEKIPVMGSVDNPRSTNKKLEQYRNAANAYYDVYNNGGINREYHIKKFFGIPASDIQKHFHHSYGLPEYMKGLIERGMDKVILEAAEEQRVTITC